MFISVFYRIVQVDCLYLFPEEFNSGNDLPRHRGMACIEADGDIIGKVVLFNKLVQSRAAAQDVRDILEGESNTDTARKIYNLT